MTGFTRFSPIPRQLQRPHCAPERPDVKRPVVADAWACSLASGAAAGSPLYGSGVANQLLVTAGDDIVAAIVANAGFGANTLSNDDGSAQAPQLADRIVTALRAAVHVHALEGVDDGAGGYDYLYNADLSRAIEAALERVSLEVYENSSETPALAATPLFVYASGVQLEEPLTVTDKKFHAELSAPSNLPVINPDHPTRVSFEVRIEAMVEDGDGAATTSWSI